MARGLASEHPDVAASRLKIALKRLHLRIRLLEKHNAMTIAPRLKIRGREDGVGDKGKASLAGALVGAICSAWAELARNEAVSKLRSAVRYRMRAIPGPATNKPANLIYRVEEEPPPSVTWISAVQHVGVIAIFMIYPLIIGRAAGASSDQIGNTLRMGMLALAIAVLLQALPRGPVGSRLLAPSIFTGVYLAPSLVAVQPASFSRTVMRR